MRLIRDNEGTRYEMYRDVAGLPTIGIGHLLSKDELSSGKLTSLGTDWHGGISDKNVDSLLREDTAVAQSAVTYDVTVPLTQNQFDALVSFVFNIGSEAFKGSTLLKLLNRGEYEVVPEQMRRWIY